MCSSDLMALQDLDHLALGHVFGAIKGHVLKKMRQALLGIGFHERSRIESEADRGLAGGGGVFAQGIAHAIVQRAEPHFGVWTDIRHSVRPDLGADRP